MEHRDRDDDRDVEPDRDVEVLLVPPRERPEEVDREDHPDDRDGDVDRPDRARRTPSPGVSPSGSVIAAATMIACQPQKWMRESTSRRHARLQQALRRVVDAGEAHVADEREDHRVGVQRAQPAEAGPGEAEVGRPQGELERDDDADQHADDAPDHGGDEEQLDDRRRRRPVMVSGRGYLQLFPDAWPGHALRFHGRSAVCWVRCSPAWPGALTAS